jgi:hypothetical protein
MKVLTRQKIVVLGGGLAAKLIEHKKVVVSNFKKYFIIKKR